MRGHIVQRSKNKGTWSIKISTGKDPATGKVLREVTSEIGACKVSEVDDSSCVATLVSGAGVKVNDLVRNQ